MTAYGTEISRGTMGTDSGSFRMGLTEHQTQRLMNRFLESVAAGLTNLRCGRPGNHRTPESLKLRVLSLLHDHYSDFGPTLVAEKLRQRHNITVSVETLRNAGRLMDSGSHTRVAGHVFINPDTGVSASYHWFRSRVPRVTGLKDTSPNAVYYLLGKI